MSNKQKFETSDRRSDKLENLEPGSSVAVHGSLRGKSFSISSKETKSSIFEWTYDKYRLSQNPHYLQDFEFGLIWGHLILIATSFGHYNLKCDHFKWFKMMIHDTGSCNDDGCMHKRLTASSQNQNFWKKSRKFQNFNEHLYLRQN